MKLLMRLSSILLIISCVILSCSRVAKTNDDVSSPIEDGITSESDTDSICVVKADSICMLKFLSSSEAIDYMHDSGHWNDYSRGILPGMAEEELEYCTRLLNSAYSRFIIVDKARMKVILYNKYGVIEKEYGMACARNYGTKHKRADSRTPEGFFSAEGIYDSTDWLFTDDNGVTSPKKGQFGPRFIRLKCPNTSQIGIHGTAAPWSIGHRVSHGCIRLTNDNILELVKLVEIGMPIIVSPGSRDMAVNASEGYSIPSVTTTPGGTRAKAGKLPESKSVADTVSKSVNEEKQSMNNSIDDNISTRDVDSTIIIPRSDKKENI